MKRGGRSGKADWGRSRGDCGKQSGRGEFSYLKDDGIHLRTFQAPTHKVYSHSPASRFIGPVPVVVLVIHFNLNQFTTFLQSQKTRQNDLISHKRPNIITFLKSPFLHVDHFLVSNFRYGKSKRSHPIFIQYLFRRFSTVWIHLFLPFRSVFTSLEDRYHTVRGVTVVFFFYLLCFHCWS